ncbi:STM3941 family protein [Lactobacillus xylocopicola]|uniref:STM3941 family protein n=1 Tax=Lactobacillus xylocopicola TaxID=2976676 RepID=UPI002952D4C5|nr:STM3941 family protein [Lactobacillus xylocopicola]
MSQPLIVVGGVIWLIMFCFGEIFVIRQMLKGKKTVVKLTQVGFYDYSSAIATKNLLIPWSAVAKVENKKGILGDRYVSVYLKEPEEFLLQIPLISRIIIKINVKLGLGQFNLVLQTAQDYSNDQLVEQMNSLLAAANG